MARPRQVEDSEILRHARAVFLEHGPSASTVLIAERCGLSQAALFKRFGTKKELMVRALLPPGRPAFLDLIEQGPSDEPIDAQLVQIGLAIALFFRDAVPCMATLHASGTLGRRDLSERFDIPPPIRLQRALAGWLDALGDRIDTPLTTLELATAFLGSLHVRAFFGYIGGAPVPDDPSDYVQGVVHSFLRGVEARS